MRSAQPEVTMRSRRGRAQLQNSEALQGMEAKVFGAQSRSYPRGIVVGLEWGLHELGTLARRC